MAWGAQGFRHWRRSSDTLPLSSRRPQSLHSNLLCVPSLPAPAAALAVAVAALTAATGMAAAAGAAGPHVAAAAALRLTTALTIGGRAGPGTRSLPACTIAPLRSACAAHAVAPLARQPPLMCLAAAAAALSSPRAGSLSLPARRLCHLPAACLGCRGPLTFVEFVRDLPPHVGPDQVPAALPLPLPLPPPHAGMPSAICCCRGRGRGRSPSLPFKVLITRPRRCPAATLAFFPPRTAFCTAGQRRVPAVHG